MSIKSLLISVNKLNGLMSTIFPLITPSLRYLFDFEALRCDAYWRAAIKKVKRLFLSKGNYLSETIKL